MFASLRKRFGTSAVVLLLLTGCLSSVARSDDGVFDAQTEGRWLWSDESEGYYEDPAHWFTIGVNALFLNRRSPPSNVALSETATGATLLDTGDNDPSWAGGVEVNFLMTFSPTTAFEFDWFTVDDWYDRNDISIAPTAVNEIPFLVTDAGATVSSRLRNMEFNVREKVYEGVTLLAGFRYVEFIDSQRVHYQNKPLGDAEIIVTDVTNRLYGFQIGTQLDIWQSEDWDLGAWAKVGVYGNAANNSSGLFSTTPADNASIRALAGKTAFVGDLAVRGTRRFGDHVSIFVGYRLMYLDGIGLAANQYPGTFNFLNTGLPTIKMGSSLLFQGIEGGLSIAF